LKLLNILQSDEYIGLDNDSEDEDDKAKMSDSSESESEDEIEDEQPSKTQSLKPSKPIPGALLLSPEDDPDSIYSGSDNESIRSSRTIEPIQQKLQQPLNPEEDTDQQVITQLHDDEQFEQDDTPVEKGHNFLDELSTKIAGGSQHQSTVPSKKSEEKIDVPDAIKTGSDQKLPHEDTRSTTSSIKSISSQQQKKSLFDSDSDEDDLFSGKPEKIVHPPKPALLKETTTKSAPPKSDPKMEASQRPKPAKIQEPQQVTSTKLISNIFADLSDEGDDEEEEEKIISTKKEPPTTTSLFNQPQTTLVAKKKIAASTLFDDSSEDEMDDLFTTAAAQKKTQSKVPSKKENGPKLIEGISVQVNDVKLSAAANSSKKKKDEQLQQKKKSSMFEESSEEDLLFSSTNNKLATSKEVEGGPTTSLLRNAVNVSPSKIVVVQSDEEEDEIDSFTIKAKKLMASVTKGDLKKEIVKNKAEHQEVVGKKIMAPEQFVSSIKKNVVPPKEVKLAEENQQASKPDADDENNRSSQILLVGVTKSRANLGAKKRRPPTRQKHKAAVESTDIFQDTTAAAAAAAAAATTDAGDSPDATAKSSSIPISMSKNQNALLINELMTKMKPTKSDHGDLKKLAVKDSDKNVTTEVSKDNDPKTLDIQIEKDNPSNSNFSEVQQQAIPSPMQLTNHEVNAKSSESDIKKAIISATSLNHANNTPTSDYTIDPRIQKTTSLVSDNAKTLTIQKSPITEETTSVAMKSSRSQSPPQDSALLKDPPLVSSNTKIEQVSFLDSDSDSDDLFGPPPMPDQIKSMKSKNEVNFGGISSSDEDDLFAAPTNNSIASTSKTTTTSKKSSLHQTSLFDDDDSDDDDLFSLANKANK
jgi:hypothetical protein